MRVDNSDALEREARAGVRAVAVGDVVGYCRVLDRFTMVVDPLDTSIAPHLMMDGFWEPWETVAFSRLVGPGDRVVDVGANFGYYSLVAAELAGPSGRVLAMEPNPDVAAFLRRTVAMNGFADRIVVDERAASDVEREAELVVPGKDLCCATIADAPGDRIMVDDPGADVVDVRQVPLDVAVEEAFGDRRVDVLKMDAEGAEDLVLDGAEGVLAESPELSVVLEFDRNWLRGSGLEILDRLFRAGFAVGAVRRHGAVTTFEPEECAEADLGSGTRWAGPWTLVATRSS